ncbi:LuxR C-terminal-related transcriptional regulator [Nocardia sp. NPDC050717]|uniref:LuxR C-terminal-related transcriptional regulator n=1 Tax=Nocardia sp. NPDC050717 TaxID=3157221 RepID=UPI00340FC055
MGTPFYPATKFAAGRIAGGALTRHTVLSEVTALGQPAVVVACAPAGYGKTTLLAQWATHTALEATWVSLEDEDDDPQGLWSAILAGFQHTAPADFGDLVPGATGSVRGDVMVPLINRIAGCGRPRILILDDLHRLAGEDTLASLDWFLRNLPLGLTVAISSRTPVELPALTRLRAHGEVTELTATDLRFTEQEIADIGSDRYNLTLLPADAARIAELTGGWPAAVSLVQAAMGRGATLDTFDAIDTSASAAQSALSALVTEGLAGSSTEIRAHLLDLSVLERFTEPLVSEVTASGGVWPALMGDARRSGLVLPLDDGTWWRMHHLVREVLHDELGRRDPDRRRLLHAKAARAFEDRDDITSTVRHLLGAEDYVGVAGVLSNVRGNFAVPRQALGMAWLDRIPENVRARDPRLGFWEAWARATAGDRDGRDRALARGRDAAGAKPVGDFPDWDAAADFVLSSACYDNVDGALEAANRFLARETDQAGVHTVLVRARRGTMLHLAGRNHEARDELDSLVTDVAALPRPLTLLVPAYQAMASLELADLDAAARHVAETERARVVHDLGPDLVYLVSAQPAARLRTETGCPAEGLAIATDALARALPNSDAVLLVPHLLGEIARAQIALGRPEQAAVAVTQARHLIAQAPDPGALPARLDALAGDHARPDPRTLSQRELEVLMLLPTPWSASEIAAELFISVNTVRSHIKAIHRKLGVSSRVQVIAEARMLGLLDEEQNGLLPSSHSDATTQRVRPSPHPVEPKRTRHQ